MTLNEKIQLLRKKGGISQAELAFKIDCSIENIKDFETSGTKINGFILLRILENLDMTIDEFKNYF